MEEVQQVQYVGEAPKRRAWLWVLVIFLILVIILVAGGLGFYLYLDSKFEDEGSVFGGGQTLAQLGITDNYVAPDFSNVISYLEEKPLVKDLPSDGIISLGFYHFTQGYRIWDKVYYITKGKVEEKQGDADMEIFMGSDYVSKLETNTICDIISEARGAGELGQNSRISNAQLLVKYNSMISYRDCLGF